MKQINLDAEINKTPVICLIDTGSEKSIISESLVDTLKLPTTPIPSIYLVTFTSTEIKSEKEAKLLISFPNSINIIYEENALVFKRTESILILGLSFLQSHNGIINLNEFSLALGNNLIPFKLSENLQKLSVPDKKLIEQVSCLKLEENPHLTLLRR